jgi:3-hydroxybutyryl-CoA dehydrogenase
MVIGIHFMNPVPVMKGVEVIPGMHTSAGVLEACKAYVKSLDKEPCEARDYAGFIVSRLVDALMNEAILCVMDGNKPEEVDKAVKLCLNHPMGPLTLLDFVGLDTTLFIADAMYQEFKDPRYAAPPLLRRMVLAGHLGRKSGQGFYDYRK